MNYRLLGDSGLRVAELALGTMTFGEEGQVPRVSLRSVRGFK
jgi:aryl-alcohol dehydrogenase-like predicted oxidoreductase